MLELWQTEWRPASRRIRERLTELGVDYLVHQVPVERNDRQAPLAAAGAEAHRPEATKARRRYLEEECECPRAVTR
jgi:hypothetical protein